MKPLRCAALVLALAVVATGCSDSGVTAAESRATETEISQPGMVPEPAIVEPTRRALEQYWSATMSSVAANVPYTPVSRWTPYRDAALPMLGCGRALAQNAGHCPRDDSIEYSVDWLDMLDREYSRAKNMGTIVILAHEFGHHITKLHRRSFKLGVGRELQADCYAGLFVSEIDKGQYPLTLQPGDAADALLTLSKIADRPDFDWSNVKAHGGPAERMAAMAWGYISGDPTLCAQYERTGPIIVQPVGRYTLRLPPAATLETLNSGSFRFRTEGESRFTTDLTKLDTTQGATAVEWLRNCLPTYFAGSTYAPVGEVESFDAPLRGGLKAATFRYTQQDPKLGALHGFLALVSRGDGTAMIIDTYTGGPAPADQAGWQAIGDYGFTILFGAS